MAAMTRDQEQILDRIAFTSVKAVTLAVWHEAQERWRDLRADDSRSAAGSSSAADSADISGGPQNGIIYSLDEATCTGRVGAEADALNLILRETGTRPHDIVARGRRALRIPWQGQNDGSQSPSRDEIERLGLRNESGQWVYYRRRAKHPGTAPQPWLQPAMEAVRARLADIVRGALKPANGNKTP